MAALTTRLSNNKIIFQKEAAENKLLTFDSDLTKVFDGINTIFNLLKCDTAPILELLGKQLIIKV